MKQVQFTDHCDKVTEPEIMHTSNNALDSSALGLSCGDLFGQPQTSLVKPDICREKSCKKKATFTLESEADDSIGILCPDQAKGIPGTYKVKGIFMSLWFFQLVCLFFYFLFIFLFIYCVAPCILQVVAFHTSNDYKLGKLIPIGRRKDFFPENFSF